MSLILGLLGGVLGLLILFLIWTNRKRLLLACKYHLHLAERHRSDLQINIIFT